MSELCRRIVGRGRCVADTSRPWTKIPLLPAGAPLPSCARAVRSRRGVARSGVEVGDPQAVRAAWQQLGASLAGLRQEAGLSQKALGLVVQYSRSSIANIETGHQHVNRSIWELIDARLNAGGELVRGYDAAEALQRDHQRRGVNQPAIWNVEIGEPDELDKNLLPRSDAFRDETRDGLSSPIPIDGVLTTPAEANPPTVDEDPIIVNVVIEGENRGVRISRRALLQAVQIGATATALAKQDLRSRLPSTVRAAMLTADVDAAEDKTANPNQLLLGVSQLHLAYQQADYSNAAALVPALMNSVSSLRLRPSIKARNGDQRRTETIIALAHLAVSKLALKFGDAQLAWIAADRARACAVDADSVASLHVAQVAIGSALLALPGREQDAANMVERSLATTTRGSRRSPAEISALGALNLLAAVIASRLDDHHTAQAHLKAAEVLAGDLGGDRNELWTAFGPTNVLIHQVGVAADSEPENAIALGERIDTTRLHPALTSRRSQVHLDLASAFAKRVDGDASATLHLLQVEQMTPQLLRVHPPAQSLIYNLLARERRTATPGLRALANRIGIAAP